MESSLKNKIQALTESKDISVQKIANELLLAHDIYEQQNKDMVDLVKKKLAGVNGQEASDLMNYVENKHNVDNIGVGEALKIFEKSKKFKNDINLQRLVNNYGLEIYNGVPEHMLAKSFIKNFERYKNINEAAYEVYHKISQGYDKNKAHQLVANTIFALENDQNAEFLQDIINSLNMAFNLPGSHVKAFVYQSLRDRLDMHPALVALVEELKLVDAKTQEKINYYQDRNGRVAVSKRLSPTLEHKEQKEHTLLIGNHLFIAGEKTLRKLAREDMTRITEHEDGMRFLELCKVVTRFKISENKLIANDGMNTYTIEKINESSDLTDDEQSIVTEFNGLVTNGDHSKKEAFDSIMASHTDASLTPNVKKILKELVHADTNESKYKFSINDKAQEGETQKIVESLQMNNTPEEIANLISLLLSNFDLVNLLDSITTFDPEYTDDTADMMQGDNVVFVVVDDAQGLMGGEIITGEPEEVADEVKDNYGIDIKSVIKEEEVIKDNETELEKEGELLEKEAELEIIEANLKKIEELDEEFKGADDIIELEAELSLEKETLVKRIAELNGEIEAGEEVGSKNEIIKNIIDQLSKLLDPEVAIDKVKDEEDEEEVIADGVPIEEGKLTITPFVTFKKVDESIEFASFIGISGLNKKSRKKIYEDKDIETETEDSEEEEADVVIKLKGDKEMDDEVEDIVDKVKDDSVKEKKRTEFSPIKNS